MFVDIFNTDKKYQIIYADPPWEYADKRKNPETDRPRAYGGITYPVMKTEEIMALPIESICDTNSLLFIWATFPNLPEVFKVIKAWGFIYKTLGFAWIKTNKRQKLNQYSFLPDEKVDDFFGIGSYTKSNCEVCLIGLKGKAKELVIDNTIPSTIISTRAEHSRKPEEARNRIIKLCGERNRIELFARQQVDGYDCWGNEVGVTDG